MGTVIYKVHKCKFKCILPFPSLIWLFPSNTVKATSWSLFRTKLRVVPLIYSRSRGFRLSLGWKKGPVSPCGLLSEEIRTGKLYCVFSKKNCLGPQSLPVFPHLHCNQTQRHVNVVTCPCLYCSVPTHNPKFGLYTLQARRLDTCFINSIL